MRLLHLTVLSLACASAEAEPLLIAVASNFIMPAAELVERFEESTGHAVASSAGSTGMLYAGITNGAPYALFLAADVERPRLLEEAGLAVAGTRFTYAIGALVLWSADAAMAGADCREELNNLGSKHLAIANPVTAPYGAAARDFLQAEGLWEKVQDNLVFGQNIAHTAGFVVTGNASLGLIAAAHAAADTLPAPSCRWTVPESSHAPLEQQAILLQAAADNPAAKQFLDFLRNPEGQAIIRAHGYKVPD